MLKVGLTGGIGAGKTAVAQLFSQWNVPMVDADVVARQVVAKGQPALVQIAQQLGNQFILPDGELNRAQLRTWAFSDGAHKQRLDALLHPIIIDAMQQQVQQISAAYVLLVVPLLFETGFNTLVDRVVVVDCSIAEQIARVSVRDACNPKAVQAIIDTQISRQLRRQHADDVIDNSSTCQIALAEQVKTLHNLYLLLAKDKRNTAVT